MFRAVKRINAIKPIESAEITKFWNAERQEHQAMLRLTLGVNVHSDDFMRRLQRGLKKMKIKTAARGIGGATYDLLFTDEGHDIYLSGPVVINKKHHVHITSDKFRALSEEDKQRFLSEVKAALKLAE